MQSKIRTIQGVTFVSLALALGVVWATMALSSGQVILVSAAVARAPAAELQVCPSGCDYSSVQAAVDAANPGDVINVAAGTYTESLTLNKPVSLMGDGPDDTIVHALNGQRVMTITGATITNSTVISGFTFTGGNPAADIGGGLLVITSAPTLRNNYIISNALVTSYSGGGLCFQNSNGPVLSGNLISGNHTVIGRGSGLYFDNSPNVTLAGNTISNNEAILYSNNGVGGSGGGAFFYHSTEAVLSGNVISGNRATTGGGLLFSNSHTATLVANIIRDNIANHVGGGQKHFGGVYFGNSNNVTLISNTISGNLAANTCGGACFGNSDGAVLIGNDIIGNLRYSSFRGHGVGVYIGDNSSATLVSNTISHNTGKNVAILGTILGGGLFVGSGSAVTLTQNRISSNAATRGGGLYVSRNSTVVLVSDIITGNAVYDYSGHPSYDPVGYGGGVYLDNATATLTNTFFADNRADTMGNGSGLYVQGPSIQLLHTTIAHNSGGDGSGIYINGTASTVAMTNTILVSHAVGISITAGNTVTVNGILWYSTPVTLSREPAATATVQHEYWGDPAFVDPNRGDYHIGPASAAIDRGVKNAGVADDIDGQLRPHGGGFDLGVDEFYTPLMVHLPIIGSGWYTFGETCARLYFSPGATGTLQAVTITLIYTYPTGQTSNRPLPRRWDITGDGSGFTTTLSLCYAEADLTTADIISDETDLRLYHYDDSEWGAYPSVVDPIANLVTATLVSEFSTWSIGAPGNEPTNVALYSVRVVKGCLHWHSVLIGVVTFCVGVWGVFRRRRN